MRSEEIARDVGMSANPGSSWEDAVRSYSLMYVFPPRDPPAGPWNAEYGLLFGTTTTGSSGMQLASSSWRCGCTERGGTATRPSSLSATEGLRLQRGLRLGREG